MSFIRRMRILAAEHRLDSDKAVARAAKVNDFVVHNLSKAGRKYFPTADNAVRIARALNTTVEYLVTGEQPPIAEIPPKMAEICRLLESMSDDDRTQVRAYAEGLKRGREVGRQLGGSGESVAG